MDHHRGCLFIPVLQHFWLFSLFIWNPFIWNFRNELSCMWGCLKRTYKKIFSWFFPLHYGKWFLGCLTIQCSDFFFFWSQSISNRTDIVLSLFLACSHGMLLLFSPQVVSNSLPSHRLQYTRLPCPSPSLKVCPSSCPLNWWCHPTFSSSVTLFSFHLQSLPASGSFPMS